MAAVKDGDEAEGAGGLVSGPTVRERRKPSDLLAERRNHMRRFPTPSIDGLIKHAERYGPDNVMDTAAECGYGYDALLRLQDACDRAASAAFRRAYPHAPAPRYAPAEDRVRELLGLEKPEEEDGG